MYQAGTSDNSQAIPSAGRSSNKFINAFDFSGA
jgi:hypothetical protein